MLNAQHGDVGYIDDVMGVHRIHRQGMWHQKRMNRVAALESNIRMLEILIDHYGPERNKPFVRAMYQRYYDLAHYYAVQGDSLQARFYARKCIRECKYNPRVSLVEPAKILLRLYAPRLFGWLKMAKRKIKPPTPRQLAGSD